MAHEGSHHAVLAPDDRDANVFTILAQQARRNTPGQLATTALGGVINAAFLMQRTNLWWLAAAYCAVSAYGAWGLLDRLYPRLLGADGTLTPRSRSIDVARGLAVSAGLLATLAAIGGFMGAALGGWIL